MYISEMSYIDMSTFIKKSNICQGGKFSEDVYIYQNIH